jgi:dCMP deaminase
MRPTKDAYFVYMAMLAATRGTCSRRNVGAVIVNARGHVLSTGYNGVASGLPHCNEEKEVGAEYQQFGDPKDEMVIPTKMITIRPHACTGASAPSGQSLDQCQAIHAEQNALLQCKDVYEIDTIYVTASPCITCTKLLLNTSCRRIVYLEEYPQPDAKVMWEKAGRLWHKFDLTRSHMSVGPYGLSVHVRKRRGDGD